MNTYYVATLASYVLVEAENERQARAQGLAALRDLYAERRDRTGLAARIEIRTVRLATPEEIELCAWHHESLKREKRQ